MFNCMTCLITQRATSFFWPFRWPTGLLARPPGKKNEAPNQVWTFPGNVFLFPVSSRLCSLSRIDCTVNYLLLFVSVCVHESMREKHYDSMILWYCEILPLLCYDSMRHDTLIVWDYETMSENDTIFGLVLRFCLYLINTCIFIVFSYCPAVFRHLFFQHLSCFFLIYLFFELFENCICLLYRFLFFL